MALTISTNVPSRKPELFAVCITFGILTAITILLRLWARLKVLRVGLQLDDLTILVAAILALYFCINVPQRKFARNVECLRSSTQTLSQGQKLVSVLDIISMT